jgi:FkbM family methyltransferase
MNRVEAGKIALARLQTWLWRFRTLRIAESTFQSASPGQILSRTFYNYHIHVDVSRSSAQRALYFEGTRFVEERHLLQSLLAPGMSVVDVGANIGYYTLMFHKVVGDAGRIICFEPESNNLRELKLNVSRNDLRNVQVFEAAVGDKDGSIKFAGGINGTISDVGELEVPIYRLDSLIADHVDFVKIDVEGFEGAVLSGAEQVIERYRPTLFVEIHPDLTTEHSHQDIVDFLRKYYSRLSFHERRSDKKVIDKIKFRYLGTDETCEVDDPKRVIADFIEGIRKRTLWIVCQN